MTYRKPCNKFNLLCHLSRFLRRLSWQRISQPIIRADSWQSVQTHFGGKY